MVGGEEKNIPLSISLLSLLSLFPILLFTFHPPPLKEKDKREEEEGEEKPNMS